MRYMAWEGMADFRDFKAAFRVWEGRTGHPPRLRKRKWKKMEAEMRKMAKQALKEVGKAAAGAAANAAKDAVKRKAAGVFSSIKEGIGNFLGSNKKGK